MLVMDNVVHIHMFQVCMRTYLQGICVLLHLTGNVNMSSFGLCTPTWHHIWNIALNMSPSPAATVNQIFMYYGCFQLVWRVWQGGAVCSDDTTFTHLMGFYTSFPETAATCSLETANTAPSLYWVSHTPDDSVVNNPLKFCWVKPPPLTTPLLQIKNNMPCFTQVILWMAKELESLCLWGMPLNSTCLYLDRSHKERKGQLI